MPRADARSLSILALTAIVVLTANCATSETSETGSEGIPSLDSPLGRTFTLLRTDRTRVKSAQPDQHVDTGRDTNVDDLVGVARAVIQKELGAPDQCDLLGNAPCPVARHWYYDFFHSPEGSVGGGSALSLTFDDSGKCAVATWMGFK